jgi:GNAT superfamily N-acetyltransferase
MFELITDIKKKQQITEEILNDLPEWFGLPDSNKQYIKDVCDLIFIGIVEDSKYIGFCALKEENSKHLNMHVLGLMKSYHGNGIGTKMIQFIETFSRENDYNYLSVLTLSSASCDVNYGLTRKFYLKNGFHEFMELPTLWDESNPAVLMIKDLKEGVRL